MTTASGERFQVGEPMDGEEGAQKILDAIEEMGVKIGTPHTESPVEEVEAKVTPGDQRN